MKRTTTIVALATLALAMLMASATDWQQFQKDEINTGWTTDYAPICDPTLVWYKQTTGTGMGGIDVVPIVGDGQAFVLDYVGNVWAFNATTGQLNWNRSCTAPGTFEMSTPAYNDGILYVATSAGDLNQGYCRVTALYANNDTERENITLKTTGGYQLYTPVTYADDRIYLGDWNGSATTTNGTGTYYCLNASNVSDILWNYTPNRVSFGYRWAGAAIIGDYILFGDTAANVTCLYNDNGTFVDYINIADVCGCSNPVEEIRSSIVWNESTGHIYFTAGNQDTAHNNYGTGHVYAVAFNATTGDLGDTCAWNNDIWYTTSTPVYYDGRIYVGGGHRMYGSAHSGKMCCLNATNGNLIWEWNKTAGRVQASPAVSVVNGRKFIYFTTNVNNGSAYCLEDMGSTYEQRWEWNPPAPDDQYILQGMAISGGMVYFGTDYGRIYALGDVVRITTTHHYGDSSPYNGTSMFNMELVYNGSTPTPLQMLKSVANVTMNGSSVYGINGLNESPPYYWYLYINGIPAPDEDIDSYQLRVGEVVHWDYSSMINAGNGSGSKSYSAMDYPEPPRSEIAKLVPEGSTPLAVLQSVADVTMYKERVYSINGLTESPHYHWCLYINGMPVPDGNIDSYQLRDGEVMDWRYSSRNNAGEP